MPSLKNPIIIISDNTVFIKCIDACTEHISIRTAMFDRDGKSAYMWDSKKIPNSAAPDELLDRINCVGVSTNFLDHLDTLKGRLSNDEWIKLEKSFPKWFKLTIELEQAMRKLLE